MRRAVIIGGGITGTLTGVALAERGWSVTLVEGAHVGAGSSSRTAAGIRQQFSTRETVLGMRYAVQTYLDWSERMGGDASPIQQNGYLFLYDNTDAVDAARIRVANQHRWGLTEVQVLEADALLERFPWVDPDEIVGATWGPTDGFLKPELVYNDAAAKLRTLGGTIVQHTQVVSGQGPQGRLDQVTLSDGTTLGADLFVDATNAWSRRLARGLGAADLPIQALKRYLWFARRGGDMTAEQLLAMPLTIAPGGAYCRPEHAGSLMMGWKHDAPDVSDSFTYDDQDTIAPEFFHKSGTDARPFDTWMALAEAIPPLAEFDGIDATTAGFYGTTPDHNPFLDFDPQRQNLLRLVGFSGHGAMFGPFSALVAAALAEAGSSLDHVEVLGEQAELAPFKIGRSFASHEAMVI
jgi:glycine/D-amino acid oxidase-like deaminating enzyme